MKLKELVTTLCIWSLLILLITGMQFSTAFDNSDVTRKNNEFDTFSSSTPSSKTVDHNSTQRIQEIDAKIHPPIQQQNGELELDISTSLPTHDPIDISGDAEFDNVASTEGWNGTGTSTDPYIISGYNFTASSGDYLFKIVGTSKHFVFQNNVVDGVDSVHSGLVIGFSSNGNFTNNYFEDFTLQAINVYQSSQIRFQNTSVQTSNIGIEFSDSTNISYSDSVINATLEGIRVQTSSNITINNNIIEIADNQFYQGFTFYSYGLTLDRSTDTNISNNQFLGASINIRGITAEHWNHVIDNNVENGDVIVHCDDCSDQIFDQNYGRLIISNGTNIEIKNFDLQGSTIDVVFSHDVLIKQITTPDTQNARFSVKISRSSMVMIIDSKFTGDMSIFIQASNGTTIHNNLFNQSSIHVTDQSNPTHIRSNYTTISDNHIVNPDGNAIGITDGNNFKIINNTIKNSYNRLGSIILSGSSCSNFRSDGLIANNTIVRVSTAIYGIGCGFNTFTQNYVTEATQNALVIRSRNNTITNNTIQDNAGYAFYLSGLNNVIKWNDIINNFQGGPQGYVTWFSESVINQNYWDDHPIVDSDSDGWNDNPYYLAGPRGIADNNPATQPINPSIKHILSNISLVQAPSNTITGTVEISWIPVSDSLDHEVTYAIYISSSGSSTWTPVEKQILQTNYMLDTNLIPDGNFTLKIQAHGEYGLSASTTTSQFTIDNNTSADSGQDLHSTTITVVTTEDTGSQDLNSTTGTGVTTEDTSSPDSFLNAGTLMVTSLVLIAIPVLRRLTRMKVSSDH